MSKAAMQQALEALEKADKISGYANNKKIITALKQALAEPENQSKSQADTKVNPAEPEQEPIALNNGRLTQYPDGSIGVGKPAEPEQPVAWQIDDGRVTYVTDRKIDAQEARAEGWRVTPLTSELTPRKPLTDEELEPLCDAVNSYDITNYDLVKFARAIERAHGITGETK